MSRLDDLPPDQRAVLLLLVQQGKSHAEIADMLKIPQSAVRERAHAGLAALAGEGPTQRPIEGSAPQPPATSRPAGNPLPTGALRPLEARRPEAPRPAGAPQPTGPRRAGALLLSGILVAIVIVIVVALSSGGGSHKSSANNPTATTGSRGTATTTSGEPHIDKQLNLVSPDPSSKAVGLVEVLSQGSKRAFLVTAEHLQPNGSSFFYAAWLYNSPSDAQVLGRAPNVTSNGQLQAVGSLPSNAEHFHQMLITKETQTRPQHPGPVVLNGPFSLH